VHYREDGDAVVARHRDRDATRRATRAHTLFELVL
jgi:hypothetical protein